MTKQDLIKALIPFPDDMEVFLGERSSDFSIGLLNSVKKKEVIFSEDPDYVTEVHAKDTVIILSEE